MPKNRSKRLRKKLHVGEFQEFGFLISFNLPENLDHEVLDGFVDQFLTQAIENNGLMFGGIINDGFVTARKGSSASEEHRILVRNWLAAHPLVTEVQIGELVDAWWGWGDFD
jgi:uncharacterized protein YggL (DUF469 family)